MLALAIASNQKVLSQKATVGDAADDAADRSSVSLGWVRFSFGRRLGSLAEALSVGRRFSARALGVVGAGVVGFAQA